MSLRCVACLSVNPATNRFCGSCGVALAAAAQTPASVSSALTSEAHWGALKHATILFADVVSSTEHVAGMDPEQAMEQLRPAVQRMCTAVEQFGGTVVRTLGDGAMALFGAPRALEGHATLACEAALCMQAAFQGSSLRIRVGLHSGAVALDPETGADTKGGGVHGHAIHLASRVVGLAEPGGICLTADCLALIRNACDVRSMGKHPLRGILEPVALYSLSGMKNDCQSHKFHEAVLSPFCGRSHEFGLLQDALSQAINGAGSVIGLSGAPGSGKSRLCHEFAQVCHAQGAPVFEVRTQLYGHATPLQPVLMLLRACFFLITPLHDAFQARERIALGLAKLSPVSGDDLALLEEFLGVADANGKVCSLNAKARRDRLLGLLQELVKNAGTKASVIIFEDLHWLDEASGEFLSALVNAVAGTHILLLLNYRPVYQPPWSDLQHFHALTLPDLSTADTQALVRQCLDPYPGLCGFFSLIVERSAGNPFFAEELVHSLVEKSTAAADSGWEKAEVALTAQTLPATIHAVIAERIDRLVSTQRTLLHICAVIGKEIPLAVLQDVAVYLVSQLESGLDGLCEVEMLQLMRDITGGRRFAFRHPLIQEVAYGTQLKARRANLHAAVAVAMESHYSAQPGEFAALIAYHYEAAGQLLNAAQHQERAAKWAGSTNSGQAIKHWRKVWTLLQDHPRSQQLDRRRAIAGGQICILGWRQGLTLPEVQPIIQEAVGLASAADSRLVQLLYIVEGRMLVGCGGAAGQYIERAKKALSIGPAADVGRVATINAFLSQAYGWAGLLKDALVANDAALAAVECIDRFDREFIGFSIEHWLHGMRSRLLIRLGRFEEARQHLQAVLIDTQEFLDPAVLIITHYAYVELAVCLHDIQLAQTHANAGVQLAQRHGLQYVQVLALGSCAAAGIMVGNNADALQFFREALALIRSANTAIEYETEVLAGLADCYFRLGDFARSKSMAQDAVTLSRERGTRLPECRALITHGASQFAQHGSDGVTVAESSFRGADDLIQFTGVKIFEEILSRERVKLYSLNER